MTSSGASLQTVATEVWLAVVYAALLAAAAYATHLWARRAKMRAHGTWPHGEAARLPEAIAALLAVAAAMVLAVVTARHPELPDAAISSGGLVVLAVASASTLRRQRRLGRRPSGVEE